MKLIGKLQSVQNSAVHLIRKKENLQHLSTEEYLRKLHWLPVKKRILFKVLLLVHKCLNGFVPVALTSLLAYGDSGRTNKLIHSCSKGEFGDRAFSRCGPKLWNLLPMNIRIESSTEDFKTKLKTFLFQESCDLLTKINEQ